jgi:hypothetical protein
MRVCSHMAVFYLRHSQQASLLISLSNYWITLKADQPPMAPKAFKTNSPKLFHLTAIKKQLDSHFQNGQVIGNHQDMAITVFDFRSTFSDANVRGSHTATYLQFKPTTNPSHEQNCFTWDSPRTELLYLGLSTNRVALPGTLQPASQPASQPPARQPVSQLAS